MGLWMVWLRLPNLLLFATVAGAADLELKDVTGSDEVHVVEFYHPMCGTCTEFSPIYDALMKSIGGMVKAEKVSIQDKAGSKMAEALGALEEGIPIVKLFSQKEHNGETIMVGEEPLPSASALKARIEKKLVGFKKGPSGRYLKKSPSGEL